MGATNTEEVGIGVWIAIMWDDEVGQGRPTTGIAGTGAAAPEIETRTMSQIYLFHEETQEIFRMCKLFLWTRLIGKEALNRSVNAVAGS